MSLVSACRFARGAASADVFGGTQVATITFTSTLAVNPGLEEVLDKNGTIGTADATTFEIINNTGGPWDGYVFRFTGSGFTYSGTVPTGGTFTTITILDPSLQVVATATGFFTNSNLGTFWATLSSGTALGALDLTLGGNDTVTGSDGIDHLTTFGSASQDNLSGGIGSDILWSRSNGNHTLIGGTGDDVFRFDVSSGFPHAVAGSAQDGSGGETENDILEIHANNVHFFSVTDIDGVRFGAPITSNSSSVVLTPAQIGDGFVSLTLAVEGSGNPFGEFISIHRVGSTPPISISPAGPSPIGADQIISSSSCFTLEIARARRSMTISSRPRAATSSLPDTAATPSMRVAETISSERMAVPAIRSTAELTTIPWPSIDPRPATRLCSCSIRRSPHLTI